MGSSGQDKAQRHILYRRQGFRRLQRQTLLTQIEHDRRHSRHSELKIYEGFQLMTRRTARIRWHESLPSTQRARYLLETKRLIQNKIDSGLECSANRRKCTDHCKYHWPSLE